MSLGTSGVDGSTLEGVVGLDTLAGPSLDPDREPKPVKSLRNEGLVYTDGRRGKVDTFLN